MRSAVGMLLLTGLLLGGCEEGKLVTPSSAAEAPPSPAPMASPEPAEAPRKVHGATGVGDTAPAPERAPPQGATPPASANPWERREGARPGELPRGVAAGAGADAGVR